MSALKAVLAEDEVNLREELAETLHAVWPELQIVAEVGNGIEALDALERHEPDVMFLDIQMPRLDGMQVAKQANGRCHIVFVTAYDKYAVAAFDQGAVDYVMKPIDAARLVETVKRLKARVHLPPANLEDLVRDLAGKLGAAREYMRWVTASQGDDIRLITVEQILYFKSDARYTLVVTHDQESLIRRPIKELADEIDPRVFWQIHRGTIVNANAIGGVTRDFRGHLLVKLKGRKETLPVSESYTHLFKQM